MSLVDVNGMVRTFTVTLKGRLQEPSLLAANLRLPRWPSNVIDLYRRSNHTHAHQREETLIPSVSINQIVSNCKERVIRASMVMRYAFKRQTNGTGRTEGKEEREKSGQGKL